jgi:Xaa-Pro aminopeptidase
MGNIDEEYKKIYDIVYEAQKFGVENTRIGMKASEVDALTRNITKLSGYDFKHAVGHGVGKEVHEDPVISFKNDKDIIENGMVITIEPGIYLEGKFGIRIEDTCLVENGKLIPLNKTSKEIKVIN